MGPGFRKFRKISNSAAKLPTTYRFEKNCPFSLSCAATATFSGRLHACVGVRSFLLLAAVAQLAARFAHVNRTCGCVVAVNCRKYFAQLLILARRRVVLVMPRGVGGG